ncbi:unnamed protein product [Trichobilharzia szidati]|nr:unnamed protein product [Trichobilharzia szidati]CAH8857090.1 unnamed protein product [Trichobilharzia szidati]
MLDIVRLKSDAEQYGQGHLFTFWDELNAKQKSELLENVSRLNFANIDRMLKNASNPCSTSADVFSPPDPKSCGSLPELRTSQPSLLKQYADSALRAVSENKVAVLLLAGGQGTRLGVSYPKGLYKPNLPSGRSLYQIQAERLCRVSHLCKEKLGITPSITWYIMTSEHTKEMTIQFFESFDYFGCNRDDIVFFEQFTLPAFSVDGKILLETKSRLAFSPDGNGGLYRALNDRGILNDMKSRGIEYVQIYCVDNILVKVPDLHFIGFCIENSADCGAEVVQKVDPEEAIGVVGVVNGRYQVLEYSEITPEMASLRVDQCKQQNDLCHSSTTNNGKNVSHASGDSRLVYSHGNICVHFMTRAFLERVCQDDIQMKMKYHRAQKKVNCIDLQTGEPIVPQKPNALKFEKFAFDIFTFAKRFFIWEVPRNEQFSPIKNGPGALKDCPKTARNDLLNYHTQLAKSAGAILINDSYAVSNGNGHQDGVYDKALIEISPLITYDGENLSCLKSVEIRGLNRLEIDEETGKPILLSSTV